MFELPLGSRLIQQGEIRRVIESQQSFVESQICRRDAVFEAVLIENSPQSCFNLRNVFQWLSCAANSDKRLAFKSDRILSGRVNL